MRSRMVWFAAALVSIETGIAQCNLVASPPTQLPLAVFASVAFDPDGSGPLPEQLVVGGRPLGGSNPVLLVDPTTGTYVPLGGGQLPWIDIYALDVLPNGELLAAGEVFLPSAGGRILRWNGTSWSTLAPDVSHSSPAPDDGIYSMARKPNGDIIVAGSFNRAGSIPANNVARWDGQQWHALGAGLSSPSNSVNCVAALPNGDVAAGSYLIGVSRWDGSSWSSLLPSSGSVFELTVLSNGNLVIGGTGSLGPGQNIVIWNNGTLTPLGAGVTGSVDDIVELPNGDLVAAGGFQTTRWNGTTWTGVGGAASVNVSSLSVVRGAELAASGINPTFTAGLVARIASTCPATTASTPSGCAVAFGTLQPVTQPWIGSTLQTRSASLASSAFAIVVTGLATLSPTVLLSSLLPQGATGCQLIPAPDLLDIGIPVGGAFTWQLALPSLPVLVGQSIHQQSVPFSVDTAGAILAVRSTNSLAMTIGAW